ncbi:MAG: Hsp20/alpha crystallin family protein [Polyangiaceae bacterium]|nr:Hsp20/alpha crystallin family protein [Polyangiaceae bacterium]
MGNIQVKQQGLPRQTSAPSRWEPSRWLSRMMAWDPFREMTPFTVDEPLRFEPAFEIKETKDSYVFRADVPGIKQSDLEVNLAGNRLTVTGKREAEVEDKGDTYYTYERSYGSFTRSFTLPESVNTAAIHADLRDGVLSVVLPKSSESLAKKIPIGTPAEKKS